MMAIPICQKETILNFLNFMLLPQSYKVRTYRKHHRIYKYSVLSRFQGFTGGLRTCPLWITEDYCSYRTYCSQICMLIIFCDLEKVYNDATYCHNKNIQKFLNKRIFFNFRKYNYERNITNAIARGIFRRILFIKSEIRKKTVITIAFIQYCPGSPSWHYLQK